jgi:hypothetical protein
MRYKDRWDWPEYNERLIKRGEFYLSLDFISSWDRELERMNYGKRGRPFAYPESFIQFAAMACVFFHLPYRQLEGFINQLSLYMPKLKSADYTTLWHRINELDLFLPTTRYEILAAVDSTGIKVTNRGEWIRKKHRIKHKGWIKVHIAVDVNSKRIVAIQITDESVTDHEVMETMIMDLPLRDVLADGAYDRKRTFLFLKKKGIRRPGIKLRKDALDIGDSPRAYAVRDFKELGFEKWKKKHRYGKRWLVESIFSAIKRCLGETLRASTIKGMIKEVARKFIFYDRLLSR